jgi:predicted ATP-grasp superfamily ATP-dependent carboligase
VTQSIPVIILGTGITPLGALRILRRAGIPCYVAQADDPTLRRSRWHRPLPARDLQREGEPVEAWLERLSLERAVLMPCSDRWITKVAELPPHLRERFPASLSEPQVLQRLVDKGMFEKSLKEIGIPHPYSKSLDTPDDLVGIPDQVFDAAILKPRNSQSFQEKFGAKAFHVRGREEVAERLEAIRAEGLDAIVQEYIPGSAGNHYFVDGFIDRHGQMRGLLVRERQRMYPVDFGNSTAMISVVPGAAAQAVDSIQRLLTTIGYRGIFSAEFKLDARDGLFKILEVNARPWWYVDFAARCGVDVCSMAYFDALGQEVAGVDAYQVGRRLVYPYTDFFACLTLWRAGKLTMWSWIRSWIGAMQPVFQWSDPSPAFLGALEILGASVRRRLPGLSPRGEARNPR